MHPRAETPLKMLSESLNEILMSVKFNIQYRKSYDSGFWEVTKENDGILGFPACMLMFSIVDTLGSYFENNQEFKIAIKGLPELQIIDNENSNHFYILNSNLFSLNLSQGEIKRIYECRTSLLHNSVLTNNVILRERNENEFIEKIKYKGKVVLSLGVIDFYYACEIAVQEFFNNPPELTKHLKHRSSFQYRKISDETGLSELTDGKFFGMSTT